MNPKTQEQLLLELEDMRSRLDEAEDTLRAIRCGEVDALVVSCVGGEQIYTLKGVDHSYRVLIEDMNQGALMMTLDGIILYSNRHFAQMIKTPLEKVIGSMISTWVLPDSQDILQVLLLQDGTKSHRHGQITLLASDGALVPGDFSANILQMEETRDLFGLVVTDMSESKRNEAFAASEKLTQQSIAASIQSRLALLSVIEDQKAAEEKIKKLNSELETRVLERTSQLDLSNKELTAFSYSVSHDLRAPLRAIDGFSLALLEDYSPKLDEQGKDNLQRIRSATQRMGRLIDDLLSLSRVSQLDLKRKSLNLSSVAQEIANELQKSDPSRDVEFSISPDVRVNGDKELLNIALTNLMQNAFKFTSRHAKAQIEFGVTAQNGTRTYFVRDDGAGFDMRFAAKMFGAFQRMHSSVDFSGTGIGLATVRRIVSRHGGKIWAESEVEKGATFYFTLV